MATKITRRVAIVLERDFNLEQLDLLVRYMPVWAEETPARQEYAPILRQSAGGLWPPQVSFTRFKSFTDVSTAQMLESLVPTVLEHHPGLAYIEVIASLDVPIIGTMASHGFFPVTYETEFGLGFQKPLDQVADLPVLVLDASGWRTLDDFWRSLFRLVGAPEWHGRNFDALNDNLFSGAINQIELPFVIVVKNRAGLSVELQLELGAFISFIRDREDRGWPIRIVIEVEGLVP
jgi:RNAse (barnase) inhibitor barstar